MKDFNIESLPVKIQYVRETKREDWACDQWEVTIEWSNQRGNGQFVTDYYTGLGLRSKPKQSLVESRPIRPKIAEVLHSLFLDASASDYNFSDWCEEYGYSDDSIKALNTYKQCLEIATNLRKAFDAETRKQIEEVIEGM
jgi:hypothetical protein